MQNALQNPHYKKIWEKVIMNRHPEAKSLEEALEMELQYTGCYFSHNRINFDDCIFNYNATRTHKGKVINNLRPYKTCNGLKLQLKDIGEIIGRPITLQDILLLLKVKGFAPLISYRGESNVATLSYSPEQEMQDIIRQNGMRTNVLFFYELTKPLHEQTPETWEKISNLI